MPWNNDEIIAPNLLGLAKNGTIITEMYVQPVCTPSRSALMTSRYPIRFGLQTDVITAPQPSCLPLDEGHGSFLMKICSSVQIERNTEKSRN